MAEQGAQVRAARLTASQTGMPVAEALGLAGDVATGSSGVIVTTVDGDGAPYRDSSGFSFVAAQELVLMMFLIGMIAAAALIQTRRLGVLRRMLAAPVGETRVLAGVTLGRFAIAAVQAGFIVFATAILFGVEWGSWTATAAIVIAFALVATASAVLIGSTLRNENQSTAVGITVGLAFAALGGCMVPFEVFPPALRTVAHITPHAWAVDAFTEVVQNGGGIADILTELGVLVGYALVLFVIATFTLRRSIVDVTTAGGPLGQSRRARPVRWRNTVSRSGSISSTPETPTSQRGGQLHHSRQRVLAIFHLDGEGVVDGPGRHDPVQGGQLLGQTRCRGVDGQPDPVVLVDQRDELPPRSFGDQTALRR